MLSKAYPFLLTMLVAAMGFPPAGRADESATPSTPPVIHTDPAVEYVPIAAYADRQNAETKDGMAVSDLIKGIVEEYHGRVSGSARITLSVPAAEAIKARYILATAIVDEGFPIELLGTSPTDGRLVTVTPKSAIKAFRKHGPAVIIDETIAAPNGRRSVHFRLYDDATWNGDDNTSEAVLLRRDVRICTFTARGRGFYFSWSPDSRYLLIPSVKPERAMTVYYLDSAKRHPTVDDLDLDAIDTRVEARLPRHHYVPTAGRSQIDVDRIEWQSTTRCRFHFYCESLHKSGKAVLELNLAARRPRLRIVSITPTAG